MWFFLWAFFNEILLIWALLYFFFEITCLVCMLATLSIIFKEVELRNRYWSQNLWLILINLKPWMMSSCIDFCYVFSLWFWNKTKGHFLVKISLAQLPIFIIACWVHNIWLGHDKGMILSTPNILDKNALQIPNMSWNINAIGSIKTCLTISAFSTRK